MQRWALFTAASWAAHRDQTSTAARTVLELSLYSVPDPGSYVLLIDGSHLVYTHILRRWATGMLLIYHKMDLSICLEQLQIYSELCQRTSEPYYLNHTGH